MRHTIRPRRFTGNLSKDFRGGEATAVMGGIDIDLRNAIMDREEAVLDVSSVMGGVKIRVPEGWTVVSRVSSIMGGFKDDTRHPANDDHRLVLKGTVIMGGLKISN
jgi:predicted membrane protein